MKATRLHLQLLLLLSSLFCYTFTMAAEESHAYDDHTDDGGGHSEYTTHVTYEEVYNVIVFLITAYVAGIITKKLGMPALVGEICTGFILGPPLAEFVPYAQALVLIGEIGLIGLILEAGIELDVAQLKQTGTRALAIGFTGSLLPLLAGICIGKAAGEDFKGALAIGASFSPTSLGVAASALSSGGMLNTSVGQLIVASCVIDDVLGLVILSMFQVLVKDDPQIYEYFIPLISSFGFLIVLGFSGVTRLPRMIQDQYLPMFPKKYQETAMFALLTAFLMAYLPLLNYTKASYLTGAFLAGATFSQLPDAHHSFLHRTHQLMEWLLRVFFAATIGFQVPVELFGDSYVIGMGFALYACVAVKFPLGFFVPRFEEVQKGSIYDPYKRDVIVTGLSMTCRGEFSFIIAAFALSEGVIDPKMYAAVVWAVLLSCTTSPFLLLNCISHFKKLHEKYLELTNPLKSETKDGKMPLFLHIHLETDAAWGLAEILRKKMHEEGLNTQDHRTTNNRGLDSTVFSDLYVRDDNIRILLPTIGKQRLADAAVQHVSSNNLVGLTKKVSESKRNLMEDVEAEEKMLQMSELEKSYVNVVAEMLSAEAIVDERAKFLVSKLKSSLDGIEIKAVSVEKWNPWDWSAALETITMTRKDGKPADMEYFMDIFNKIDADGSGTVDEDELFTALNASGIEITRDNLKQMVAVVDENGDGEISREEWQEAISYFLQSKNKDKGSMNNSASVVSIHELLKVEEGEVEEVDVEQNNAEMEASGIFIESENDARV